MLFQGHEEVIILSRTDMVDVTDAAMRHRRDTLAFINVSGGHIDKGEGVSNLSTWRSTTVLE